MTELDRHFTKVGGLYCVVAPDIIFRAGDRKFLGKALFGVGARTMFASDCTRFLGIPDGFGEGFGQILRHDRLIFTCDAEVSKRREVVV